MLKWAAIKSLTQGYKITDADKNRLAEEINILYVAATRARNKLIIPPEISPLQSIEIAVPQQQVSVTNLRRRTSWLDDEYEKLFTPTKRSYGEKRKKR